MSDLLNKKSPKQADHRRLIRLWNAQSYLQSAGVAKKGSASHCDDHSTAMQLHFRPPN